MPMLKSHVPQLQVRLYKTVSRATDGAGLPVSQRYAGKADYIDLAQYLGDGSSVRTSKSLREPAGGFSITIPDKAVRGGVGLESLAGLVEPQDVVEIRMSHHNVAVPPVIMRGFVSSIQRTQSMGANGRPQRSVVITGQDYGKIWQMLQILFLPRMLSGQGMLTNFKLFEVFGVGFQNALPAGEFIRQMIEKVVNKHLREMMPEKSPNPVEIKPDILVKHGTVSVNLDSQDGTTVYDIMRLHGDVGIWNELYVEDRQDGVYGVYRPTPALHVVAPDGSKSRLIQPDAPEPLYVEVLDNDLINLSTERSDANVANFYWVRGPRFNVVTDAYRMQFGLGSETVSLKDYPNAAEKYYGPRAMYADTQQGGDATMNHGSGLDKEGDRKRQVEIGDWIDQRRKTMVDMNKDNVILEHGSMRVKGGLMRPGGQEPMKAGDYARLRQGRFTADYYVSAIDHEFLPFQGYFSTLRLERGEGFVERVRLEGGRQSPWLLEQMLRF